MRARKWNKEREEKGGEKPSALAWTWPRVLNILTVSPSSFWGETKFKATPGIWCITDIIGDILVSSLKYEKHPTLPPPDVGSVNCRRAFVKQNTLLWKQWVPTPPAVVMMQWKPIRLFLKQTSPDSESLTLALFECDVLRVNLKPRRAAQKYPWATFTMR